MLFTYRQIGLVLGLTFCLASSSLWAQCGGRGGSSSGGTGFSLPTSTASSSGGVPYNQVSSNQAMYQIALASQRQQMEIMYRQMMIQQNQLAALQQQLAQKQALERQVKQQELVAARKERAAEKEKQKSTKLASTRSKIVKDLSAQPN